MSPDEDLEEASCAATTEDVAKKQDEAVTTTEECPQLGDFFVSKKNKKKAKVAPQVEQAPDVPVPGPNSEGEVLEARDPEEEAPFDLQMMLKWRHAAAGLRDDSLVIIAVDDEQPEQVEADAEPVEERREQPAEVQDSTAKLEVSQNSWAARNRARREAVVEAPAAPAAGEASLQSRRVRVADDEPEKAMRRHASDVPAELMARNAKLQVSENSWAARQRARRESSKEDDDAEFTRNMKSILNKLTVEKFAVLYEKLISCGIQTVRHVELIIQELFEKATTQHHFINMYADLCAELHEYLLRNPIGGNDKDAKTVFKKILLNECQASFERHLAPPADLAELCGDERELGEVRYKTRMLGNIRFVGALLTRKMLASKVAIAIVEELLSDPTPEALESLAALLTVIGPVYDTPEWVHHLALKAAFERIKAITKKTKFSARIKCLLKDVLDLRAKGWEDSRPKKIEGPTTLNEQAHKAAVEHGEAAPAASANGWTQVPGKGGRSTSAVPTSAVMPTPPPLKKPKDHRKSEEAAAQKSSSDSDTAKKVAQVTFHRAAFRAEVKATLLELAVSHDVQDAAQRIGAAGCPTKEQAREMNDLLSSVLQESTPEARARGITLVANLFLEGHWSPTVLVDGIRLFATETCDDLICDIPMLPKILQEEVQPGLAPLVEKGLLEASRLKSVKIKA
eukprot:gnl/TRDRNA2_/TRDRNA2_166420_c1_seq1.p1 gnl/TRDRNA2_/TRDRNA2_166420_c1~~gnl/TRDRNA2_/TRDRNA2_166420_c1_seq1.p1  ORF type:complete len:733 (+),score=202.94 gnl/TRDRNA2_/TRDRNA2_166420_c1_seq1:149-2200(+)